jgi:DNA-binding Lrp family transcriptional regulator
MTRGAADWAWQNGGIAGDFRQIVGRCDGLPQMDQTDRRLMTELSRNARLPVATLARRLGLARSTVQARLDRLEGSGAIAGYAVIPGPGAAPERMRATVLLQVEPQAGAAVLQRLRAMAEVTRVISCAGRVDLLLDVVAEGPGALDAALDRIGSVPGLRASESLVHLATKIDRQPPAGAP